MTLRGRLTTAFLAMVLGPVALASLFVGTTVSTVSRDRTVERLDHAATTVRTAISALCRQLQAVADAVAVLPAAGQTAAAAELQGRGLASTVRVGGTGDPGWRDCGGPADGGVTAMMAHAQSGSLTVFAAQSLDPEFVSRLAASSGAEVTLLAGGPPGVGAALSTLHPEARNAVVRAATRRDTADQAQATVAPVTIRTHGGERYVRRLATAPGQPLPLVLSVRRGKPVGLYVTLLFLVVLVAAAAVVVARWLARSTTRPLAALAGAADRVADGDLDTRVPIRGPDELGRLAGSFNRMTRELQAYVQALTAGRDQLRGHLAILGDTLSSTHDLQRILQVILLTARSATSARAGAVLLIDPAAGVLVARCAEGLPELLGRVPLDDGVLGAVATTGEPQRGSQLDGSTRTYVAVPICAPAVVADPLTPGEPTSGTKPAVLGVLALYDRLGANEFDDTDLLTLRTFAGQAGVAVHNVRMHEEAQRLSFTDPLTGLWNYRYLRESLRREVERASRFGRMLAVLALDLDHFKNVNDTYGHAAGDAVLTEFARRVRDCLREVDVPFRQGGEEFVVLLPETDGYGGAIVAERLGAAVRNTPVLISSPRKDPQLIPITVSVGIAVYPEHGPTAAAVLAAADEALYVAKNAGRDTYRLAEPIPAHVLQTPPATVPGGIQPPRQGRGR